MSLDSSIIEKIKKIKLLILDVDGVLTDGKIIYPSFGLNRDVKEFDVKDGFGVKLLYRAGIPSVILSGRSSRAIRKRAKDMRILAVYENAYVKLEVYEKILKEQNLKDSEVAFIGDDLVDIPVLKRVGFSACTACSVSHVKELVDYITKKEAGAGAVREIAEIILNAQGLWGKVTKRYFN
jgi:3-deoxy-D-manno-octulosonate 8-phosphate phosphatase (KDO 8-P phosphatase)